MRYQMDRVIHMVNTSGKSEEAKMRKSHKAFQITHSRTACGFVCNAIFFICTEPCMQKWVLLCVTLSFPWCMVEEAFTMILSKLELMQLFDFSARLHLPWNKLIHAKQYHYSQPSMMDCLDILRLNLQHFGTVLYCMMILFEFWLTTHM